MIASSNRSNGAMVATGPKTSWALIEREVSTFSSQKVAGHDELNGGIEERHHDVGILLPRHAEEVLDALLFQSPQKKI